MKKIIVMGGSFNPPTIAHQKLLLAAVRELNAAKGIFVPSSHAYVKTKMRRAGHPEETLSESLRLAMLNAMAADDSRLAVDDLEYHRKEKGYTYETMVSLRAKYPDAELYFLAGGDINITDKVVASGQNALGYDYTGNFMDKHLFRQ